VISAFRGARRRPELESLAGGEPAADLSATREQLETMLNGFAPGEEGEDQPGRAVTGSARCVGEKTLDAHALSCIELRPWA
jgi:hypothetical protein